MILTPLADADRFTPLLPGMQTALDYLRTWDPATPDGTHLIDGDRIYALVSSYDSHPSAERRFEAHRRNADVQWIATSFALFPLAIACNFVGIWLVRVTPEAIFYRITNVIVFVLGLELTRQGVVGLLWR